LNEGSVEGPEIRQALEALPEHSERLTVLGCYPAV